MSSGRLPGRRSAGQHSFLADLRAVLAERNFRRLFATRLISQAGDGMFTAGLGAYVFFNATTFPDPGAAAAAFAVLYLPYSLVGPFAGVFIDRWQRRQILVWSAVIRSGFVALAAFFIASGTLGLPLYLAALAVLGVNRFFLSALSAALPRVVADDKLVMANSVAPTSGTIVAFAGGLIGLGVHRLTGGGPGGSAAVMAAAGACYLVAGLAALRMARGLLGPDAGGNAELAARRQTGPQELRDLPRSHARAGRDQHPPGRVLAILTRRERSQPERRFEHLPVAAREGVRRLRAPLRGRCYIDCLASLILGKLLSGEEDL